MMKSTYCVACIDAAKARFFALDSATRSTGEEVSRLVEVKDLTQPGRRQRDSNKLANSRPGLERDAGMPGSGHAVDDKRDAKTDEGDRTFAADIAETIKQVVTELGADDLVIAASPRMLGRLRESNLSSVAKSVHELDKNLSSLSASELRDRLVKAGVLPGNV